MSFFLTSEAELAIRDRGDLVWRRQTSGIFAVSLRLVPFDAPLSGPGSAGGPLAVEGSAAKPIGVRPALPVDLPADRWRDAASTESN